MEIICDMRDALLFYLFYIQNFFLKVHKKNYYFSPLRSGVHSLFSHLPDRPAQQESPALQVKKVTQILYIIYNFKEYHKKSAKCLDCIWSKCYTHLVKCKRLHQEVKQDACPNDFGGRQNRGRLCRYCFQSGQRQSLGVP